MKIKLRENKDQQINTIFILCHRYEYARESYIFVYILLVFCVFRIILYSILLTQFYIPNIYYNIIKYNFDFAVLAQKPCCNYYSL